MSHDDGRLPDEVRFVKFSSVTWTHDSKGFFYQVRVSCSSHEKRNLHNVFQRYPERKAHGSAADDVAGTETESDMNAMLYYHRVGTIQGTVPL